MDQLQRRAFFNQLSSQLCGIRVGDSIGLLEFVIQEAGSNAVDDLLDAYRGQTEAGAAQSEVCKRLLEDPTHGPLCRSIMKLRLLGSWYPPAAPERPTKLASGEAYTTALCWKIMQSHSPGLAGPMDGPSFWEHPPQALGKSLDLVPNGTNLKLEI